MADGDAVPAALADRCHPGDTLSEGATASWEDLADGVLPLLCCVQGTDPSVMLVMLIAEMFPEPEGGQVSVPSVWVGCTLC